ncbi:hypothetical protein MKX03_023769 [Papaver bracteatum]|nr:hypothetical protein MKX03_023769 [Papaver bracteatum]
MQAALQTRSVFLKYYSCQNILIKSRSFQSSSESYANYIDKCGRDRALSSGQRLHAYLITTNGLDSFHLASKFISFYAQCGRFYDARKVFDKIPKTSVRRWVVLVGAYSHQGCYQEILDVFVEMQRQGFKPNQFILPSILKACAHLSDIPTGKKIHCVVLRSALFDCDSFISCSLIYMYSKCGPLEYARNVLDRMVEKDPVALNSMVSGYTQHGFAQEAFHLVEDMKIIGLQPNLITWNALIAGFSKVGDPEMALETFRSMRAHGIQPDTVSWTSVISGFVQNFQSVEAFDTFKQMLSSGVRPSSFTISGLLPACAIMANSRYGKEIHGYALVNGVEEDIFVSSALVDMYSKCGFILEAEKLFIKMRQKNTVTWNSMIFGYSNHGYCNEALDLFNQMLKQEEVRPDHLTFTAALTACSHARLVEYGQNLFRLMQEEYKIEPRIEHYACLVDVLGRAGEILEAYDFIKKMPVKPDVYVWGAFLAACRNHGNIELAETAAKKLNELEPENAGNSLLLSNLYSEAGNWGNAERLKKMMKKKKLTNLGCSWI